MKQWDVFISHASEDKKAFVEPLAIALANAGVAIWYDKFTMTLGDSLSRSIDQGLANSKFGVVVLSPSFLDKFWTDYELTGLVSREVTSGKTILPIWHGVTRGQIVARSPTLADKLAVRTSDLSVNDIAMQVLQVVRPDLYGATQRAQLIRRMNGEAIQEMEAQIGTIRAELDGYHCPDCGAPITEARDVQVKGDPVEHYKAFACGRKQLEDEIEDLCPSSPIFPRFEDLPISITTKDDEKGCLVFVDPRGRPGLWLDPIIGRDEEHACQLLRAAYDKRAARWQNT
ncbi:TIR domain-containing protein [Mesorhizobium sp. B263B2A]|uniref:TIR domain-containing protein n=1 Tax=Mesorhizobium sp. B263B2A TaxID=2876669 RepID=UPI001CD0D716|nr:TIR domain-containing protein [Mesorhizobium sp. B263B2A]MCA0035060.1 TIR domain-containing protein [Mesorhizobium sp. B263B2A]